MDDAGRAFSRIRFNKNQKKKGPQFKWVPRPQPSMNDKKIIALLKVAPWLNEMEKDQINPDEEERRAFYENAKPNFSDRKRWIVLIELWKICRLL